jgi:hypothetical protein
MSRLLQLTKILALGALAFLLISLGILSVSMWRAERTEAILAAKVGSVLDNVNAALATINRPCKGPSCGTLAGINLATHEILVTTGQFEIVANHEKERIGIIDKQEDQLAADMHDSMIQLHTDLKTANTTLLTANTTIAGIQPIESQLVKEAVELQLTTASLKTLISNPQIPLILTNVQTSTKTLNSALAHVDATVADTQQAVHHWLHPTFWGKVKSGVEEVSIDIGKVLF